jgi:choline dehydrogenase
VNTPIVVTSPYLADPSLPAAGRPSVLIIGSGAAGLMTALRLADAANVTILEAGADAGSPPPRWLLDDLVFADGLDWGVSDAATGLPLPRGKVTGGSTSVNAAAALRGQPWDFDEWNLDRWTWADVAPALAAIEADKQYGDAPHHGAAGPIPITRLGFGPIDHSFVDWALAQTHEWADDQNAPGALGVGEWPTNMVGNGRRWGTHAAVLPTIRDRVTLRSSTEVTRLVFDGERCVGVEVDGPNGAETLYADHVVLAAGAFNSPAGLFASGIGPAGQLAAAGIPVRLDAPEVGQNLQDHPWSVLQVRATDASAPGIRPVNGALLRYEIEAVDHVEVHLYPHQAKPYLPEADAAEVIVGIGLMRATSRGAVSLAADGSLEVRLGALGTEQDKRAWLAVIADASRYIDDMVEAGVFDVPVDPWWKSDDLDAAIATELGSYGHAVGTCRMGDDDRAVVDQQLSLRGFSGISIADASVMPASPRANTMLASMMVGWRAADFVADELGLTIPTQPAL